MKTNDRQKYIEQLFLDNGAVELRVLGSKPASGLYDDMDAFLHDARQLWYQGHIYSSLNAPKPRKVSNRLAHGRALRDEDIGWITRLPFDFDPIRPAGVGSSDAELERAYVARNKLIDFLGELGWPEPIRACSGNGYHAQFPTRLPNNEDVHAFLGRLYKKLENKFGSALVQFDTKVKNPSRVFRLYGTVNRKGQFTDERPHRQSDVLMPASFVAVTIDQLVDLDRRLLMDDVPATTPVGQEPTVFIPVGRGDYRTLDVVSWFKCHGLYKRPAASSGKHYVTCPWLTEHSTPDGVEKTDTIIYEADSGWPGFHCSHAHCDGRTIREVLTLWPDADAFCSRAYHGGSSQQPWGSN